MQNISYTKLIKRHCMHMEKIIQHRFQSCLNLKLHLKSKNNFEGSVIVKLNQNQLCRVPVPAGFLSVDDTPGLSRSCRIIILISLRGFSLSDECLMCIGSLLFETEVSLLFPRECRRSPAVVGWSHLTLLTTCLGCSRSCRMGPLGPQALAAVNNLHPKMLRSQPNAG